MTGLLRLQYGIFVSKCTQDNLKEWQGDTVKLPINESKIMKAHLAEWISESAIIMKDKKRENVVHCWEKTGILSIWNVDEWARLAPRAF